MSWYLLLKSAIFLQTCNNAGNCHCSNGFSCPRCDKQGLGGSVDSGMGCQNVNESETINKINKTTPPNIVSNGKLLFTFHFYSVQ